MPGFDGTGPLAYGPMTGRGLGPCGRGLRRGFGFAGGRRRGWGRGFAYGMGAYEFDLKGYKRYLETELETVKRELAKEESE